MRMHVTKVGAVFTAVALIAGCGGGSGGSGDDSGSADGTAKVKTESVVSGVMPTDGPAEDGGTLTIQEATDAATLDIQKSAAAAGFSAVVGRVYSKLLDFDTGKDVPYGSTVAVHGDLAESYEHSKDGLTWTFKLRKGVKWQNIAPVNGRLFTSADVVCTINRIQTLPGIQKNLTDVIKTVDAPDDSTVVFNLSIPFGGFDTTLATYFMAIVPCEGTRGEFDMSQQAIGTGPFILKDWKRKQERTYIKNPDYFVKGKPHLDQIRTIIQSDPAATVAAFRTGDLDYTGSQTTISTELVPAIVTTNPDAVVRAQLSLATTQVTFNQAVKPFDDYRVRKAFAMAWDRAGMGETYYPNGFALAGAYPSTMFGAMSSKELTDLVPFDPAAAKKLLADAGYPNGLDVELLTTDGYGPIYLNQAQWVQQDLKDIGVNASLKVQDYATYISTFQAKNYTMTYGISTGASEPDEWLEAVYKSDGPRNWFNSGTPELDKKIAAQRGIIDRDERAKALHELSLYITENVLNPVLSFQGSTLQLQQPYVHNLWNNPQAGPSYFTDVWLDKKAPGRK
ncbi:MAG: peptide transporter substrate-binding protein [Pseudonocardiales bacterium]|nr:peptide transporter substrate-binding protein [Pseudonocardiales bacterium]